MLHCHWSLQTKPSGQPRVHNISYNQCRCLAVMRRHHWLPKQPMKMQKQTNDFAFPACTCRQHKGTQHEDHQGQQSTPNIQYEEPVRLQSCWFPWHLLEGGLVKVKESWQIQPRNHQCSLCLKRTLTFQLLKCTWVSSVNKPTPTLLHQTLGIAPGASLFIHTCQQYWAEHCQKTYEIGSCFQGKARRRQVDGSCMWYNHWPAGKKTGSSNWNFKFCLLCWKPCSNKYVCM